MTGTSSKMIWLPIGIGIGLAAMLFLVNPAEHGFFPPCLFHKLTGWHCPACGATRAAHALLHGRLAEAWRDNALFVLALPVAAGLAVRRWRGRKLVLPAAGLWILGVVLVMFAVWRNLPAGARLSPP